MPAAVWRRPSTTLQKAEDMLSNQPIVSRRSFLVRSSMVLGGVVAGPALLSACTKTSTGGTASRLDQLKSSGKITVGIAGEQPYAFLDHGKLTGMDPTVQMAVWKAAGINGVEAKQVSFDALIPGLNAGDFDVISAGMFINPTRCQQAAFSEPVYVAPDAFLVPPGNPDKITDFKLEGLAILNPNEVAISNDNDFGIGDFPGAISKVWVIRLEDNLPVAPAQ